MRNVTITHNVEYVEIVKGIVNAMIDFKEMLQRKTVAIVGTSHVLSENEELDIRKQIALIIKDYPPGTIFISGGAKGVDVIALEIAKSLGYHIIEYAPEEQSWSSYRKRNLFIASKCDDLYCISIPVHQAKCYHHERPANHEKTAGCWTLKRAEFLGKKCKLVIV